MDKPTSTTIPADSGEDIFLRVRLADMLSVAEVVRLDELARARAEDRQQFIARLIKMALEEVAA